MLKKLTISAAVVALCALHNSANADDSHACKGLPSFEDFKTALTAARGQENGGFDFDMWGTLVNRDGVVCALAKTGSDRGDQWPGSRVISAQKANTANAFSLPGFALSTANLYSATQPGGSLFGLQESNPVDTEAAYKGPSKNYGKDSDPLVGEKIGGVNVFGGGLALYNDQGVLIGAIGVSGDSSCADHNIAWRTRDALGLDHVPAGVGDITLPPTAFKDNIIFDIAGNISASGWGHPACGGNSATANTQVLVDAPLN
ncbi:conserved exported hypothetical protein [Candidatus Methylobacter favarea]|uniref:Heme-binding protein n=1 Tax=Candidatus Methylobacter favarea TaxID=2707345 RepID=A0A8S0XGV7_9GAMM|nr:heme-binding protein [Candidatus Methylobacter favarea]CAA9891359.1 conserved exported hypothetical protein [Candidatus Methylobacter favarea]